MRLVETRLERQDDQHARDVARDLPDPSGSPCPDARADEVCDGNAVHPQASRQAQIEVRAVDQQRGARTPLASGVVEHVHRVQDPGQRGDHLRDAHHRDVFGVDQRLQPFLAHPRSAGPKNTQLRLERAQLAQHRRAVQIGGRFQGDDEQLRRAQATCSRSSFGPSFSSASRTRPTSRSASCGG